MTQGKLIASDRFDNEGRPLLLVIMDGIGIAPTEAANAITAANTPTLDRIYKTCPGTSLQAHGKAVGLPSDADMGNSEVGHNALGAGQVFDQGAKLVNQAITGGTLFGGKAWQDLVAQVKAKDSTLHFIGLLSDGNVHSHIEQLTAMINQAAAEDVTKLRVHPLLDGRDVPETSSPIYIKQLETALTEIRTSGNRDYLIASGGGRMVITMDRYEAEWEMVARGWDTHVRGVGRGFPDALTAIETLRGETKQGDQFLPPFVIHDEAGKPVGPITDGDAVIFFNFRGDRAIEISLAFTAEDFPHFDRAPRPDVAYAGMMQYDGDTGTPEVFLVPPPQIDNTLGEYMADAGITQLACAETQKFGHVTYFWNGNRSGKFSEENEHYIEVPSDIIPFEERPWMQAAQVTDAVLEAVAERDFDFIRINYANGDMVGHTGHFAATVTAVQAVDLALERLMEWVEEKQAIMVLTADHGNADQMFQKNKAGEYLMDGGSDRPQPLTAHTLNPVPLYIYDPKKPGDTYTIRQDLESRGLANVPATILDLMGYAPPEIFAPSLLQ